MLRTILIVLLVLLLLGVIPTYGTPYGYGLGGAALLLMVVLLVLILSGGAAVIVLPLLLGSVLFTGCREDATPNGGRVVAHHESESKDWLDSGRTKSEDTTIRNPDGSVVKRSESETKIPPKQ